jgi:hypothetical protein
MFVWGRRGQLNHWDVNMRICWKHRKKKKTDPFTIFVFQNWHNNKLLAVYILPSNTTVFYCYYYIQHVLVCTAMYMSECT